MHFTYRDINGAISDTWYDNGLQNWHLRNVNTGGLTIGPAAAGNPFVCLFGGQQHVAWHDSSGAVWDAWSDEAGPWSLRQINLQSSGDLTKGPAAAGGPFVWAVTTDLVPIQLHFTYQSADGTIWDSWYNAPHYAWNLQQINDGGLTTAPAAAAAPFVCVFGTEQHVGYVDGSGNIWDAWYDGIASWSKRQINNRAMTKGPGALHGPFVWVAGQQLHFTYQDTGLSIWDASVDANRQWDLMQVRGTVQRYSTTNGGACLPA